MTGPRGIPEFIFIVESDKAFAKLQNDTKIDLLAISGTHKRFFNVTK